MTGRNRTLVVRTLVATGLLLGIFVVLATDFLLDADVLCPLAIGVLAVASLAEFYGMTRKGVLKAEPVYLPGIVGILVAAGATWFLFRATAADYVGLVGTDGVWTSLKLTGRPSLARGWGVACLTTAVGMTAVWTAGLLGRKRETAWSVLGFAYVAVTVLFLLAHRYSFLVTTEVRSSDPVVVDADAGLVALALLLAVAKGSDIGAYLVGRKFGRTKLAPRTSPNKSVEGAVGGLAASVLIALAFWGGRVFFGSMAQAVGYGLVVGVAAQVGDLLESRMKRANGVKDSGKLFLSMGGVMDVLDSVFLAAPASYAFLALLR